MTLTAFGKALRSARMAKGLSQQQLADAVSISRHSVAMAELGKHRPRDSSISAYNAVLGCNLWSLLDDPASTVKKKCPSVCLLTSNGIPLAAEENDTLMDVVGRYTQLDTEYLVLRRVRPFHSKES